MPCHIPKTEERGITTPQLQDVYAAIEEKSGTWCAAEQFGGQLLNLPPEQINLYHVNDNHIKLVTADQKCSYVELVAIAAQPPEWFISQ